MGFERFMLTPSPVWQKSRNGCCSGQTDLMFSSSCDADVSLRTSRAWVRPPERTRYCFWDLLRRSEGKNTVFMFLCSYIWSLLFGEVQLKGRFWHICSDCQVEQKPDEFGFRSHARRLLFIMFGLDVGQHEGASMTLQGKRLDLVAQICMAGRGRVVSSELEIVL